MPFFSIIIPVYNASRYLHRCLSSILTQSFSDFECILVDDGSNDGSKEICEQFLHEDPRFRYFWQSNSGEATARNRGLLESTGTYICYVDADDWVSDDYLRGLYADVSLSPDVDLVIQGLCRVEGSTVTTCIPGNVLQSRCCSISELLHSVDISPWGYSMAKAFRRSLVQTDHLQYDPRIRLAVDLDFLLRYLQKCRHIVVSPLCNYQYVIHAGSLVSTIHHYSVELQGLRLLSESWQGLYLSSPIPEVQAMESNTIANLMLRTIVAVCRDIHNPKPLFSELHEQYGSQYRRCGDRSTPFLSLVYFLFVHRFFALLACVVKIGYRV